MKRISIFDIKDGMILLEDVVTENRSFLLGQGSVLKTTNIEQLEKLSIYEVLIKEEASFNISGLAEMEELGNEIEFKSNDVKTEIFSSELKKEEVESKFETLSATVTNIINNLKIKKEDISKLTFDIKNFVDENLKESSIYLLDNILNIRDIDEYLYRHSVNVSVLSYMLGKWLNYSKEDLDDLLLSALFHDIGKVKVLPEILNKKGRLTNEEFKEIKKHPVHTFQILKILNNFSIKIMRGAAFHHEKIDGSGYPLGLKEEEIPEFSKIISVADIFDAMTSDRVYHKKKSPFTVLEMFENEAFGKLDYKITNTFVKKFLEYYVGEKIILNNGEKAKIIRLNLNKNIKPLILTGTGKVIDMANERNSDLKIEDFVE